MGTQADISSALQLPAIPTDPEDRDPGNSWEAWAGSFQIIQHETDLKQRETFPSKLLQPGKVKQHSEKHHPSSWIWNDVHPSLSVPASQYPIPWGFSVNNVSPVTSGRRQ